MFNDVPNRKEVEFETIKVSLYHTRKKSIFLNGLTIDFGGKLEDSFESVSFGALKHDVWWDRKEGFLDYYIKSHSNIVQKISIFSNGLTHDFDYKIEISSDFVSLWKGLRYDDWRSPT